MKTLSDYLNKFYQSVYHDGWKVTLKRLLHKLLPEFQHELAPVNAQDWLRYYQTRPEMYQEKNNSDPADMPIVSVLILTYNNLLLNQLCLHSVYANTTYPNFEVIVVDNGSVDETPGWLKQFAQTHPNLRLFLNSENRGFAGGNNQAAREAKGEYLIFLNNDTVVTRGWVEGLLAYFQTVPQAGLVGPVTNAIGNEACIRIDYSSPYEMEAFAEKIARKMKGRSFDIRMLAFYCVMARKAQYETLGGLDERFAVGMFEDDDIAVRYQQEGFRVLCAEDVFIHHFHRSTFGKLAEEIHQKIFDENREKYEQKWGHVWRPYHFRQTLLPRFRPKRRTAGILIYRCNICGRNCKTPISELGREKPSCRCGSTVRTRAIVHILSTELFGQSLALPDFPERRDLFGWGMSDAGYSSLLTEKLNYVNTFYHQEPRLDITAPLDPAVEGRLDFLISTEVFEHINPPVSVGFENARRLLKPKGVFVFSVPYSLKGETREHFPDLYQYEVLDPSGSKPYLRNITRAGQEQIYNDLVFHGGPGSTLEMRVFSQIGLMAELKQAGFGNIKIYSEPCWEFGIYWHKAWALPLAARL